MRGLVTDRGQNNIDRLNELRLKGWENMTAAEKAEWSGDPLRSSGGVNLIPFGSYINTSTGVRLSQSFLRNTIRVDASNGGVYQYAVMVVGAATEFENKTLTLSLETFQSSGDGKPLVAAYWHDANGFEHTGGVLEGYGSVTFNAGANTAGREYLALYIYATTDKGDVSSSVLYDRLMLEFGAARHEYVPYSEIVPTAATKGAYNYSDINRISRAANELLSEFELDQEYSALKENWTAWDIPTSSELQEILTVLLALQKRLPNPPELPDRMERLTYTEANNIELMLSLVGG